MLLWFKDSKHSPFYSCVLSCQAFDLGSGWSWPCCDKDQYQVSMITKSFTFQKQHGFFIITRSSSASLLFKGLATKHITVKWTESNREVTIHRSTVSTLLSSAFIKGDLIFAQRGPFTRSLISCPFFWGGVNMRQAVSRHHHDLRDRGQSWYARLPNKGSGGNIDKRW